MFRLIAILAVSAALLVSSTSCSSTMRTPEGRKYKPFSKFNFLINNNQVSSASVYKRYVAYNKRQQKKGLATPQQVAKNAPKPAPSTTGKSTMLAAQ